MSLILKLSKCRLCLKLGDFYSIFASDNSIQLANMAMACSDIKIQEGDGLPDKICGECIEKLSSAYIFKQQCERSDSELRKSLGLNTGSVEIASYGRRSSDSGYSNRTDSSTSKKDLSQSSTSVRKSQKSSDKSFSLDTTLLRESFSVDVPETLSYEGVPARQIRDHSNSRSNSPAVNDLARLQCQKCRKTYQNAKTLRTHVCKVYLNKDGTEALDEAHDLDDTASQNSLRIVKSESISNVDKSTEFDCDKCGQSFKFNIMLKRHQIVCRGSSPTVSGVPVKKKVYGRFVKIVPMGCLNCPVCKKTFKKRLYVLKHLRATKCKEGLKKLCALSNKRKRPEMQSKPSPIEGGQTSLAECCICSAKFSSHLLMFKHFQICYKRRGPCLIMCKTCNISYSNTNNLLRHIKTRHLDKEKLDSGIPLMQPKVEQLPMEISNPEVAKLKCRECEKTFDDQNQLVMHLAAHMANIQDPPRAPSSASKPKPQQNRDIECSECFKKFRYKASFRSHMKERHDFSEEDLKGMGFKDWYQCDMCDRAFKSNKNLKLHKVNYHSKPLLPSSELIVLSKIPMKCLMCDVVVRGPDIRAHNLMHIAKNEKPRNKYECPACQESFLNRQLLSSHVSNHNRSTSVAKEGLSLPYPEDQMVDINDAEYLEEHHMDEDDDNEINAMDFCESVVANIKQEKDEEEPVVDTDFNETVNLSTSCQSSQPGTYNVSPSPHHIQKLVVALGGFTCALCNINVDSYTEYQEHMKQHQECVKSDVPSKCVVCDQEFKFESQLKKHLKEHIDAAENDASVLACKECGRHNKNYRAFIAHKGWHDSKKDLKCHICMRVFAKRRILLTHFKRQHANRNEILDPIAECEQSTSATPFQCHICNKYMKTAVSLGCHVQWHSSKSAGILKRYQCPQCSLAFTNKTRLVLHLRRHNQMVTPFHCTICGLYFVTQRKLSYHVRGHRRNKKKTKRFKCPVCDQLFSNLLKVQRHIKRSHPENVMVKKQDPGEFDLPKIRFICKVCGKEFDTQAALSNHTERHLRKPSFLICSLCGKRNISRKLHTLHIKSHMCQKFKDNPLQCQQCDKTFVRRQDLHIHMYEVHDTLETYTLKADDRKKLDNLKEYQCHVCFKVLAKESTFLRHLDYHNSMRCNYCLKYFNSKTFMDAHVNYDCDRKKVLNGGDSFEKRLKCLHCYKAFSLSIKLRCHMRTQHQKEYESFVIKKDESATCDFCFVTFASKPEMEKHKLCHSRIVNYWGCKHCPKKFGTLQQFYKHMNKHRSRYHTDDPLPCEYCQEKFVFFNDYASHLKDVHDKKYDWILPPKETTEGECHICKKVFIRLHNHMKYHEKCSCQKCKQYFTADYLLESHVCPMDSEDDVVVVKPPNKPSEEATNNTVQEPYEECQICFKAYTHSFTKHSHISKHNNLLQFGCLYCDKTFSSQNSFRLHSSSHRRRHYKNNPLLCKHCGEKFIKYGLYLRHLREIHNEKESMILRPFFPEETCKICNKMFKNIHFHYRAHKQFQCQSCHKYIMSERLFKTHICNDPNEDKNLVIQYDGDITSLAEGKFDYSKLRHRPLVKEEEIANSSSKDLSVIEISENELSNCESASVNISEIDDINPDIIMSESNTNSSRVFSNFKPIISSTVSLSEDPGIGDDYISNVSMSGIDTSTAESSEEIQKIVNDLESSYPSDGTNLTTEDVADNND